MEMIRITSRQNDAVKRALGLSSAKGRKEQNAFFTEGIKLYREALDAGFEPKEVFLSDSFLGQDSGEIKGKKIYSVTDDVYSKISEQSAPEGIFCVFDKFILTPERDSCVLLLENMQDPGNLGTVIRSSAALGAREVVTVSSCDAFSPKTVRATMGALFRIPVVEFDSLSEALQYVFPRAVYAAALTFDAVDLESVDTSRACIMIGNEGHGLSKEALDSSSARIIIPIEQVESLNASSAASIVLYDAFRKRQK